ncbi:gamma-glutamyl-gamma-aminobutyrate hydrolase family protein [Thermococcus sp.]|uniref:gamma-glutamyl-gamma-aminobutyrate hydrolase family protein n=1 Tax=Thermococcus sp. TaxID=35749 RepID=UPI00261CE987|nr:gamma-glutamyl-gamma-aminobutyrate hydrolase family protein [Thermococcus sp.]
MKPLIAIIDSFSEGRIYAPHEHLSMVSKAGGLPAVFSVETEPKEVLRVADGLLLIEGPDVHPRFYGGDPSPKLREVDVARDEFEIELVKKAIERGIPVMGIGRGMHIINITLGGTLYQDVYEIPKAIKHDWNMKTARPEQRLHTIRVKADSLLYSILKEVLNVENTNEAWTWVNSFHHQAIKRVGEGLRPVAFAIDGLVEAIESSEGFLLGVQWGPEYLEEMVPLYRALVNAASGRHRELEELMRRKIEAEVRERMEGELSGGQGESHHSSETNGSPHGTTQT